MSSLVSLFRGWFGSGSSDLYLGYDPARDKAFSSRASSQYPAWQGNMYCDAGSTLEAKGNSMDERSWPTVHRAQFPSESTSPAGNESAVKAAKVPVTQGVFRYFPRALLEVAKVSAFGANKHGVPLAERGFLRPEYTEEMYENAIGRHLLAIGTEGEINTADGDLYHRAQLAWNALASLERFLIRQEQENS